MTSLDGVPADYAGAVQRDADALEAELSGDVAAVRLTEDALRDLQVRLGRVIANTDDYRRACAVVAGFAKDPRRLATAARLASAPDAAWALDEVERRIVALHPEKYASREVRIVREVRAAVERGTEGDAG